MAPRQLGTQLPGATRLDLWALACLITGAQAALVFWVPVLAAVMGLAAILFFVKSSRVRRRPGQALRGRGMAIVGLITGCFAFVVGLLVTFLACGLLDTFDEPGSITTVDDTATFEQGCDGFRFARTGGSWGLLWTDTNRIGTGQLDIELYCKEKVYFGLFDNALRPTLKRPIKLLDRECQFEEKYNLLATETGFLVTYLDGAEVQLAAYELGAIELKDLDPLLSSNADILTHDSFGGKISTFYQNGKVLLGIKEGDTLQILGARPGQNAGEIVSIDLSPRTYRPKFHGTFTGPSLFAWTQASDPQTEETEGEVAYAFSANGRSVDRKEVLLQYSRDESYNIDLAVLGSSEEISVFIHKGSEIWQQRFGLEGTRLGPPQLLVREDQGIYNFNAASTNSGCFILYTAGNSDLKSYSCRTNEVRNLDDDYNISMGCDGSSCLYSAGHVVRRLAIAGVVLR